MNAFILSGGFSRRMKFNKALLQINNKTIVEIIIEALEPFFEKISIITNSIQPYRFLNKNIFGDIFPHYGPVSGIHSALTNSDTDKNFIISCDLPFINKALIKFLLNQNLNSEILLPEAEGEVHKLCGIYSKSCLKNAENLLLKVKGSEPMKKNPSVGMNTLLSICSTQIVNVENQDFYHKDLFFNMNTYDDYLYAKNIFESNK